MAGQPSVVPSAMSGNGKLVELSRDGDAWVIRFVSEPRTSPQPLWFNLEARDLGGAPVRLIWDCADTNLGNATHLDRVRPVLRADEGDWRRCESVEVVDTPDGRRQVVFGQGEPCERLGAAFCYPYGPDDLEATLGELEGAWEQTVIGLTGQGRELPRLRCSGGNAQERGPGLYIVARQHAGETPGSWVLDGILRLVASETEQGRELREGAQWWVVPFTDLDGVVNGDYGKDALPCDFNRAWELLPMRPEVHAVQHDLRRFAQRSTPRVVLDLHAPGHSDEPVFVHLPRDERPEQQKEAARSFVMHLVRQFPELDPDELARPTRYASRWDPFATVTCWAWDRLEQTPGIVIETSYQRMAGKVLEREDYREIGRRVAVAALSWLRARAGA